MLAHHYLSALELARAASQDTAALAPRARAALQGAGDRAFALNAFAAAAGYYRAALALWPEDAQEQRAGLLRLLGTVLYEAGDLEQAETVLTEGAEVAAAAGLPAVQARIRVLLAEIHTLQGGPDAAALAECEAAIAVLDSEGDLEGLAEAWTLVGRLRFWLGESPADQQALERAIAYARQSGNHRAQRLASILARSDLYDAASPGRCRDRPRRAAAPGSRRRSVGRGRPFSSRFRCCTPTPAVSPTPARRSHAAGQCIADSGAKLAWAECASHGRSDGTDRRRPGRGRALPEGGVRGVPRHGGAGISQQRRRLARGGALRTGPPRRGAADDRGSPGSHRARRHRRPGPVAGNPGQAARPARPVPRRPPLLDEAAALVSPTSWAALKAQVLMAKAEVNQLAGAPERGRGQPARGAAHLSGPARRAPRRPGHSRPRQPHRPPRHQAGLNGSRDAQKRVLCARPRASRTLLPAAPSRQGGAKRTTLTSPELSRSVHAFAPGSWLAGTLPDCRSSRPVSVWSMAVPRSF